VLLGVFAFMLWTRLQSYGNFVQNGEVYFRGNDPWYHFRETMYIMENYPNRMPFDVWTGFPLGNQAGQFGTLWDHIMAVGIWIARPIMGSAEEVMLIMAPSPARSLRSRRTSSHVGSSTASRPSPRSSSSRSCRGPSSAIVSSASRTTARPRCSSSLAILAFLVAVAVAEREAPVWELVVDRDWAALKRPAAYAAAAGVALGLYMWTWQPGALVVGFTGVFLAIKITSDVSHGKSPEPVAFAGAVSMVVAGLMQIVPLDTFRFAVSEYSLLQIVSPLGVALGAVFLAWLARQWESRDLDAATYPPAVGGLILHPRPSSGSRSPRCVDDAHRQPPQHRRLLGQRRRSHHR